MSEMYKNTFKVNFDCVLAPFCDCAINLQIKMRQNIYNKTGCLFTNHKEH